MRGDRSAGRARAQAAPDPLPVTDTDLAAAGQKAIDQAMALIRERHESGRAPDHMHYHNRAHTAGVIARARAIGEAMGMAPRELLLTTVAGAFHDTVQHWSAVAQPDGALIRQRHMGPNEVASAHEACRAMAGLGPLFTPEENGVVASAILATIPTWDGDAGTVAQPFLVDHPVIRAVALADIGAAGMDPDTFCRDGPALFAEENLDFMQALGKARRAEDIPAADRQAYRARYLTWLNFQPGFARGRERRMMDGELTGMEGAVRQRVLQLFSHFAGSVAAAEAAATDAETLDFVPLMRQLDPTIFPDEP